MADISETIRDRIKTIIESVEGYNIVFGYGRVLRSEAEFEEDFSTEVEAEDGHTIAKGWTIQLIEAPSEMTAFRGMYTDRYVARLTCAWTVDTDGSSEVSFFSHTNQVKNALTTNISLQSLANIKRAGPASIISADYFNWGNRLAHVAVLTYPIEIQVSREIV
jgi:hypothetical protein